MRLFDVGGTSMLLSSMGMMLATPPQQRQSLSARCSPSYLKSSSSLSSSSTPSCTAAAPMSPASSSASSSSSASASAPLCSSSSSAFFGGAESGAMPYSSSSSSSSSSLPLPRSAASAAVATTRMGMMGGSSRLARVWGSLRGSQRQGQAPSSRSSSSSSSSRSQEGRRDGYEGSDYTALSSTALSAGAEPAAEGKKGEGEQKRVLLLISDTGGGHRASAQALEDAMNELYPGQVKCDIVDIWTEHACWPYNRFVPSYKFMAKNPFVWRLFWFYGKMPISRFVQEKLTLLSCFRRFKKAIESYEPDMVVSVHPLCQDIPLRALGHNQGARKLPFATVVTDLGGAHPLWFDRRVDVCFVPSDPVRKVAERAGLQASQLRQHGLPIRSGFWHAEKRSKVQMRKELKLDPNMPTTLVVGGGDGVGGITRIAEALAKSLGECDDCVGVGGGEGAAAAGGVQQLVVVCGKNEKVADQLREKAEAKVWGKGVEVNVQGFVTNMEDFMAASDCIVTKAGPGTIAESMCRGLPTMLSCFLPGQEAGNVPFVTEGGFGDYSKDPETIASTVSTWMRDPEKLQEMSRLASSAGRPSATYDIARDLGDMLFNSFDVAKAEWAKKSGSSAAVA